MLGWRKSYLSPAGSSNSGSASHSHSTAPNGNTVLALGLRVSAGPSATREMRPRDQIADEHGLVGGLVHVKDFHDPPL